MSDESREDRLARLRADRRPGPKLTTTTARPAPRVKAADGDAGEHR